MINELNPSILIPVDQYETYTLTVEATQNFRQMELDAPTHVAQREAALVQSMRDAATENSGYGYLFH